jgi:hypothetical protein
MEPKTDILDTVSSHQERYSEMERLNKECLADKISQLNCDDFAITEMVNTANYIHDNLSTMTEEELRRYYVKIMNVSKIKNELLKIELSYYKPTPLKEPTLNVILEKIRSFLHRYQLKAGGHYLDDTKWILHDYTSKEHKIKEDEFLLENTVSKIYYHNDELQRFLYHIIRMTTCLHPRIIVNFYTESFSDGATRRALLIRCRIETIREAHLASLGSSGTIKEVFNKKNETSDDDKEK